MRRRFYHHKIARAGLLLLAAIMCLRALVPVGYMLSIPSGGASSGFALYLCPSQNPHFDLAQLSDASAAHGHHHHHDSASLATNSSDEAETLAVSAECRSWINSVAFTPQTAATQPVIPLPMMAHQALPSAVLIDQYTGRSSQARAPPQRV